MATKTIVNIVTGETQVVELTPEEETERQNRAAASALRKAKQADLDELAALKDELLEELLVDGTVDNTKKARLIVLRNQRDSE